MNTQTLEALKKPCLEGSCCQMRGTCIPLSVCPEGAVTWTSIGGSRQKGIIGFDKDKCTSCGLCVETCIRKSIVLK